jgi:hypothetical protein
LTAPFSDLRGSTCSTSAEAMSFLSTFMAARRDQAQCENRVAGVQALESRGGSSCIDIYIQGAQSAQGHSGVDDFPMEKLEKHGMIGAPPENRRGFS